MFASRAGLVRQAGKQLARYGAPRTSVLHRGITIDARPSVAAAHVLKGGPQLSLTRHYSARARTRVTEPASEPSTEATPPTTRRAKVSASGPKYLTWHEVWVTGTGRMQVSSLQLPAIAMALGISLVNKANTKLLVILPPLLLEKLDRLDVHWNRAPRPQSQKCANRVMPRRIRARVMVLPDKRGRFTLDGSVALQYGENKPIVAPWQYDEDTPQPHSKAGAPTPKETAQLFLAMLESSRPPGWRPAPLPADTFMGDAELPPPRPPAWENPRLDRRDTMEAGSYPTAIREWFTEDGKSRVLYYPAFMEYGPRLERKRWYLPTRFCKLLFPQGGKPGDPLHGLRFRVEPDEKSAAKGTTVIVKRDGREDLRVNRKSYSDVDKTQGHLASFVDFIAWLLSDDRRYKTRQGGQ